MLAIVWGLRSTFPVPELDASGRPAFGKGCVLSFAADEISTQKWRSDVVEAWFVVNYVASALLSC